jgi:hypothetical protein
MLVSWMAVAVWGLFLGPPFYSFWSLSVFYCLDYLFIGVQFFKVLYVLGINSSQIYKLAKIFSHSVCCLFSLISIFFALPYNMLF